MQVITEYHEKIKQIYMSMHPDANPDKVMSIIQQTTENHLKDIPCVMHNNMKHELVESTMLNTFDWIKQRDPIISGNGTFFKQHDEYLSPSVLFLETEQKARSIKKKEMFKQQKGTIAYVNLNVAQMNVKVIMNADYGGSGTPLSPFYSVYIPPATTGSAKNMTTTLICCLEFISGNKDKWAKMNHINELYDMIFTVLNDTDTSRQLIQDVFTVEEVCQYLLSKTNNVKPTDALILKRYLSTLSSDQLSKLMLAFNIRLVLTKYMSGRVQRVMSYLKRHKLNVDNITRETLFEAGYGVEIPEEIKEDIEVIKKTILDNCVYPFILNDAEIRATNMKRIIVCVTDTDSLMVHFPSYINEFQSDTGHFRTSCLLATALGMRIFVEGIIPRMVEDITTYCNIEDEYYRKKFVFKNEFGFLAMALFAKKMYASSIFVQEGNPRDIHEIAISGLSFKKRDSAEFLEPIMTRLYDKYILTADHISVDKLLDEYYALRNSLKDIIDIDPSKHKVLTVKDKDAYDQSKILPAQIRGSIIWNHLKPDEEILPMDRVIVIPLSMDLLKQNTHIPELDRILSDSMNFCTPNSNGKQKIADPVICLPEHYKEIPEWIRPAVDKDYCMDKLLSPFKQILGLFDVYMADTKGGVIPSRMIYL